MNGQRIVMVLLVANLFATLLVYRGMVVLVERVERLPAACAAAQVPQPVMPDTASAPNPPAIPVQRPVSAPAAPAAPVEDGQSSALQDATEAAVTASDDTDVIATRFANQYTDAAWTAQIQEITQNVAGDRAPYSNIRRDLIECRENICRLVLGYSDETEFNAFIDELTMALKGDLAATVYFDSPNTLGGNSTVDVYLVRE